MKRKILSLLLVMTMGMALLVGCGSSDKDTNGDSNQGNASNVGQDAGKEDSADEKEEIDTSIYSEKVELVTEQGKKVLVYYDPTVVNCIEGEDWTGKYAVDLGEMINVSVADAESAKARVDDIAVTMGGDSVVIGKQEEIPLADYTIHYFTLNDKESGAFYDKMWGIELDSDVVVMFITMDSVEEGSQLEKELEAIKFVVE